jgi:hypothetical protein
LNLLDSADLEAACLACLALRTAVAAQVDRLALYLHNDQLELAAAHASRFTRAFPNWQRLRLRVWSDGAGDGAASCCLAALLQQLAQLQPQLHHLQLELIAPCSFSLEALCGLTQLKSLSISGATELLGSGGGLRARLFLRTQCLAGAVYVAAGHKPSQTG